MYDQDLEHVAVLGFGYLLSFYHYLKMVMRPRQGRRYWVHPINQRRDTEGEFATLVSYCLLSSQDQVFQYTRLEAWQLESLLEMLRPVLTKSNRKPLSPLFRLALTLKYLAHGGSIQSLAWNFRVGRSTAQKIILETCNAIWQVVGPHYVALPSTLEEWHLITHDFWRLWNFPNCIGAIDGKHIAIETPPGSGSEYYNYKSFNSIVLMASCDAHCKFMWVDVGSIGSKSDGGIFAESTFGQALMAGEISVPECCLPNTATVAPCWFVADEAFPLKEHIMRPYPGRNLEDAKKIFNYRLSRARRTIENSFGILVARWRIFQGKIRGVPKNVEKLVLAAVTLHNFAMSSREMETGGYCPENFMDHYENGVMVPGQWRNIVGELPHQQVGRLGSNNAARRTIELRNTLAKFFVEEGESPYHYSAINRGWAL